MHPRLVITGLLLAVMVGNLAAHDNEEKLGLADRDVPSLTEINAVRRFAYAFDPDYVPRTDADKALIRKVVRYYLYRLSWPEVHESLHPETAGTLSSIMREILGDGEGYGTVILPRLPYRDTGDYDLAERRKRQLAYVGLVTPMFLEDIKRLLENERVITRLNATRVLAHLAAWGRAEVVSEFVYLINNPKESDAIRLYCFHGMRELLELEQSKLPRAAGLFATKAGDQLRRQALRTVFEWATRKTALPDKELDIMKPDEVAGVRFVRRAAWRALGASGVPILDCNASEEPFRGEIAHLLRRVVAADASLSPVPDSRERLDAAVAICGLKKERGPSFHVDAALYDVARFVLDLGVIANGDRERNKYAWSYEASRLNESVENFVKQRGLSQQESAFAQQCYRELFRCFRYFDDPAMETASVKDLADWLRDTPQPHVETYAREK